MVLLTWFSAAALCQWRGLEPPWGNRRPRVGALPACDDQSEPSRLQRAAGQERRLC